MSFKSEVLRPQAEASRQGIIIHFVPLDPAGHVPVTPSLPISLQQRPVPLLQA